jgi:flagellar motility protein MotE (MotC chaperone)
MVRLLQSGWFCMLAGAVLYWGVTLSLLMGAKPPPANQFANEGPVWNKGPSWDFFNPELDRLVDELKKEKLALNQRAKNLDELEARLQAERAEINQVTQTVYQLRFEYDKNYLHVREEEALNLKKMAKLYAAMSPEVAVSLFKEMTDDDVVKILVLMKDTDAVTILESLAKQGEAETRRVAALTDRWKATLYRNASTNNASAN